MQEPTPVELPTLYQAENPLKRRIIIADDSVDIQKSIVDFSKEKFCEIQIILLNKEKLLMQIENFFWDDVSNETFIEWSKENLPNIFIKGEDEIQQLSLFYNICQVQLKCLKYDAENDTDMMAKSEEFTKFVREYLDNNFFNFWNAFLKKKIAISITSGYLVVLNKSVSQSIKQFLDGIIGFEYQIDDPDIVSKFSVYLEQFAFV
jgi:hypothetical protein